jgi:hypothetical protein
MRYWLVSGIRDPQFTEALRGTLRKLAAPNVSSIIVETGPAVGYFEGAAVENSPGVVPFLVKAFDTLAKLAGPDDWFVRIDADDYYGPGYLQGIDAARLSGADATGIASPYVRAEDGQMYYCSSRRKPGSGAYGGTLAGSLRGMPPFRSTPYPWGEDTQWVEDTVRAGRVFAPRSTEHYAWCRWEGATHTFPVPGHAIPHMALWDSYELGVFSETKAAQVPEQLGQPIPFNPQQARRAFEAFATVSRSAAGAPPGEGASEGHAPCDEHPFGQ